jgi:hypothetical protein
VTSKKLFYSINYFNLYNYSCVFSSYEEGINKINLIWWFFIFVYIINFQHLVFLVESSVSTVSPVSTDFGKCLQRCRFWWPTGLRRSKLCRHGRLTALRRLIGSNDEALMRQSTYRLMAYYCILITDPGYGVCKLTCSMMRHSWDSRPTG